MRSCDLMALVRKSMTGSSLTRLEADVRAIALPEGRMVGVPGHEKVRAYLDDRLGRIGLLPYKGDSFALPYSSVSTAFCNLVGVIPGKDRALPPVLVGAHYDSIIPAPCADDNASGVAVALEIAWQIQRMSLGRDVVIALFDAEEPPYFHSGEMGSLRFYEEEMDDRGVHAALIMDLMGHDVPVPARLEGALKSMPDLSETAVDDFLVRFASLLFVSGAESSPALQFILDEIVPPDGLQVAAVLNRYVGDLSDHKVFRQNGVPYLFTSCARWEHYHQVTDTVDRLNFQKMTRNAAFMTVLVNRVSAVNMKTVSDEEDGTLDLELRLLKRSLGPSLDSFLGILSIAGLETRNDMDMLAKALLTLGL
jgi:hypothetical protein